jgi:lipopolysaccharide export system ATP-binding protein
VSGSSVLRAEGLVKTFGKRRVVDVVDLEVKQGEIVGLLGPNGAGKTTTFYMIVGLLSANSGKVFLDDQELTRVPMYRRARAGIGYLSQEPSIFRRLTVEQNVMAILQTLDLTRAERQARLDQLLGELSIGHLRKNKADSLSGGERRRLEITRALVTQPKFMLLDEPFAGVDPIAVDDIQRIVAELRERGLGVLITDHNVRETLSITDRAYLMFNGRIHIEGPAQTLVEDPEARKMYLGLDFEL